MSTIAGIWGYQQLTPEERARLDEMEADYERFVGKRFNRNNRLAKGKGSKQN